MKLSGIKSPEFSVSIKIIMLIIFFSEKKFSVNREKRRLCFVVFNSLSSLAS